MKSPKAAYIGLGLVVALSGLSFFWDAPTLLMKTLVGQNMILGAFVFVLLMFGATVVAPVTVLPLVPFVAPVFGPFLTALLSILGWGLGAVVAFLIARYAGRPLLARFVSLDVLDRYEQHIGTDTRFWGIIMLRMLVPVDILSYAIGLFSRVPLVEYTVATVIGISFFSFVFAYLGDSAVQENIYLFGGIVIVSVSILGLGWWYMVKRARSHKK